MIIMIVNLTPHTLNIFVSDSDSIEVPPSGTVARCSIQSKDCGEHDGIPLTTTQMGEVVDLPDPIEGTLYVVSMVVRQAVPERTDIASPGTLVRDETGKPKGCQGLVVNR